MSQKKVATLLDVSDDTLRNWENGTTQPRDESLAALAEFCDLSLEELFASQPPAQALVVPPPTIEEESSTASRVSARTLRVGLAAVALLATLAIVSGFLRWRSQTFKDLRPFTNGVEAISRSGKMLWRASGVDPRIAERWTLVRMPGGRTLFACVLAKPFDYRPHIVGTLSLLEPNAKHVEVVERIQLPAPGRKLFPSYAGRYELAYLRAIDLDDDGLDEIIATYQQVPESVSYTVLYEPALKRARVVFVQTGAHHLTGAWDIDGDGRRDLLFLGINNGYNWMNSLAAVRISPWIGARSTGDELAVYSPDSAAYLPFESNSLFYALLPRGRVPDDPAAVSWDAKRRLITVKLLTDRKVTLTPLGFPSALRNDIPEAQRATFRREAYRHDRESRRLSNAGLKDDAVAESREAVVAAERAADPIVSEAMQRDLAKALISAGHSTEGEELVARLAAHSENASEIYYDAAVACHLAGNLRRAVKYYEAGIGRGGSPEAGKSKHEFLLGEVLALVELGEFAEAERAVGRVHDRYVTGDDWTALYREFVRWQRGDEPPTQRLTLEPNATDLARYWSLEFRNARGEDAELLLHFVDELLADGNRPKGALLSLRAVLLERSDRGAEGRIEAQAAMIEGMNEATRSIGARGHMKLVTTRRHLVSASGLHHPKASF